MQLSFVAAPKSPFYARRVALAMIVSLCALVGGQLHRDYVSSLDQGTRLADSVANAAAQHLHGSLRSIHSLLEEAADGAEYGRWTDPEFVDHLSIRLREFPEVLFLCRVDRDGWLRQRTIPFRTIPDGGMDVSDRGYYLQQRESFRESKVWIGDPAIGRLTHERTIHVSHPILNDKGEFDGVVMAAVSPDGYAEFLNSVLLEPAGGAAIIKLDGAFLARAPDHAAKFGTNIANSDLFTQAIPKSSQGVVRLISKADGNDKLLGYRVLTDYDMVVTSGITVQSMLKDWWRMLVLESVTVVLFSAALYYWAWQADIRQKRNSQARTVLEQMVSDRTSELEQSRRLAEERSRRLEAMNGELRRLAQVTAHHLQEPVRPIVSYSQMSRRKIAGYDSEVDGWLQFVERSGLRLKALLRDFQRYASVLAEEPSTESIDADEALSIAMARLRSQIAESGAEINHEPLPWVRVDRDMLSGVFLELIDNAIRHRAPDRLPTIHISTQTNGDMWTFSVADNAKGIDEKLAAKAFDAFERLGDTSADSTGLGLAICRSVIQAHGGRIWIEPQSMGTTFRFTLPKGSLPELPLSPARQSGL